MKKDKLDKIQLGDLFHFLCEKSACTLWSLWVQQFLNLVNFNMSIWNHTDLNKIYEQCKLKIIAYTQQN